MEPNYFDYSVELDYEAAQYRRRELLMQQIERRVEYWVERQNQKYLELYRSIVAI